MPEEGGRENLEKLGESWQSSATQAAALAICDSLCNGECEAGAFRADAVGSQRAGAGASGSNDGGPAVASASLNPIAARNASRTSAGCPVWKM